MSRIRLVTFKPTEEKLHQLEQTLADYFPILRLEKGADVWYLHLAGYDWKETDARFLSSLVEQHDLLAGWHYQDWG